MLFNSYEFIFLFLPISFFVYFYLNHKKLTKVAKIWLIVASLFFYSWWNIIYLPLILLSIIFNYKITQLIIEHKKEDYLSKKRFLQIGLFFNIGLLIYFKYMDFFIQNINIVIGSDIGLLHLALPLAISFFTLQQIAFLVDSYEGLVKERDFLDYMVFVTFFPQLIAGPIVHHKEMMPQFGNIKNKVKNYKNIAMGIFIFSIGLFKKAVIADRFAVWATAGFDTPTVTLNMLEGWVTSLSYTFQLYFDFSGYTDMAIGIGLMFNIMLPINFHSPYKSLNIQDFWRRWHITLSNFITMYIYTPIIKSFDRFSFHKAMVATVFTFFIIGLWHGASWMFVIFGTLHGLALVIFQYWKRLKIKMPIVLAWFITFNFANFANIFFRAKEWDDAIRVLNAMYFGQFELSYKFVEAFPQLDFLTNYGVVFGAGFNHIGGNKEIILAIPFAFLIALTMKNSKELADNLKPNIITVFIISVMFAYAVISFLTIHSEFLYFNF